MRLKAPITTRIGALGTLRFKPGYYVYSGSAKRNLSHRLTRHSRRCKRLHWHIDYLTRRSEVSIESTRIYQSSEMNECELNSIVQAIPRAEPISGFGCSDCRCRSHLTFIGTERSGLRFVPESSHARQ
jgi:Uri superfamily endonuclease